MEYGLTFWLDGTFCLAYDTVIDNAATTDNIAYREYAKFAELSLLSHVINWLYPVF